MAEYYKLSGSKNSTVDWTSEVILEKDDDGQVTKSVGVNRPAQLNKDDLDTLKRLGYEYEKVSADEAKEAAEESATSPEALGTAPLIGEGTNAGESSKSESKSNKK